MDNVYIQIYVSTHRLFKNKTDKKTRTMCNWRKNFEHLDRIKEKLRR